MTCDNRKNYACKLSQQNLKKGKALDHIKHNETICSLRFLQWTMTCPLINWSTEEVVEFMQECKTWGLISSIPMVVAPIGPDHSGIYPDDTHSPWARDRPHAPPQLDFCDILLYLWVQKNDINIKSTLSSYPY